MKKKNARYLLLVADFRSATSVFPAQRPSDWMLRMDKSISQMIFPIHPFSAWDVSRGLATVAIVGVLLDVEAGDRLVHGVQDGRAVLGEQM